MRNDAAISATLQRSVEVIAVAALYILLARIGQFFAISPGNITPVWIPSGVMLALVLLRGNYLLVSVFFGAMLGNAWAYIDTSSLQQFGTGALAATMNGAGDVVCVALGCYALSEPDAKDRLFQETRLFRQFLLYAVVVGPAISALFGVGGLLLAGILGTGSVALSALYVWWIGDAVGVLAFTPLILSYFIPRKVIPRGNATLGETLLVAMLIALLPLLDYIPTTIAAVFVDLTYFLIPILLWSFVRVGLRAALWGVVYLVVAELLITYFSEGTGSITRSAFELQYFVAITVSTLLTISTVFWEQRNNLKAATEAATHDPLTRLGNRRSFQSTLDSELSRQWRYRMPLSLMMFDIDHFKVVNDQYGHKMGDQVLEKLARLASDQLRAHDAIARWGGEEFVILLPETDQEGARIRAERLRAEVENFSFIEGHPVTISIGVAEARPGTAPIDLVETADQALYVAKNTGRNRVSVGTVGNEDPGPKTMAS